MADHPHDAPTSRRRSTPLRPFIAPRDNGRSGQPPRPADGTARRPNATPTRLFTPPGVVPRRTPPPMPPAMPPAEPAAPEGRGAGARAIDDVAGAPEDWFDVVDADRERTEAPTRPAVLTPSLFNGLSGIEAIGPTAEPGQPAASALGEADATETDPYAWPDVRAVIGDVLERLAARVRSGELPIPPDVPASTEEAALAAVLSALLRSPEA